MGDRHGPNRLSNYVQIHETVMNQLIDAGCVESETLEFTPGAEGNLILDGEVILRAGKLKVTVTKDLEVTLNGSDEPNVQTRVYSYNVSIIGGSNVFRYCSPHTSPGPEHHLYHHRHQYDPFGPDPLVNEVKIDFDGNWPLLSEVIQEAEAWYWEHHEKL